MAETLLSSGEVMDMILDALEKKQPLSIVSVGATEAFVMSQYHIYTEEQFMQHPEARNANKGIADGGFYHRGIRFPNIQARDEAVEAVKKADIISYNTIVKDFREFAHKVFAFYGIQSTYTFEANIRRVIMFSQKAKFERMLQGRKIVLIGFLAQSAKTALERNLQGRLGFEIVGAIPLMQHEDIPDVKKQLEQIEFDLCLLSAGVNALILAPYVAVMYSKVAFDIGSGMKSFITGEITTDSTLTDYIGIERIMNM